MKAKTFWFFVSIMLLVALPHIAEVPGQPQDPQKLERLIEDLKDESWQVRWSAAEALGETKDPRAVEPLIAALKDKNVYVRSMVAWALGELKDPCAVEPLICALKDDIKDVRRSAAIALQKISGKDFREDPIQWEKWWKERK